MLLSGTLHTPAIEARDSCQASALPPEPHLSMCDTILSLLSCHKHKKTQIRKKKILPAEASCGKGWLCFRQNRNHRSRGP